MPDMTFFSSPSELCASTVYACIEPFVDGLKDHGGVSMDSIFDDLEQLKKNACQF